MLEPDAGGWIDGWLGIGPRKTDRIPIGKFELWSLRYPTF